MTTLTGRPNSALLVVDMQVSVVASAYQRDEVVANIARLVERARLEHVAVLWVQHVGEGLASGTEGWAYVPELTPVDGEVLIHKRYGDAFEETQLESELGQRRIGRLVITGAQTDACIRSTIHGAFTRGYDTVLVSDAHTTEDLTAYGAPTPEKVIAHTNLYWTFQSAPGRAAAVVATSEVSFASADDVEHTSSAPSTSG